VSDQAGSAGIAFLEDTARARRMKEKATALRNDTTASRSLRTGAGRSARIRSAAGLWAWPPLVRKPPISLAAAPLAAQIAWTRASDAPAMTILSSSRAIPSDDTPALPSPRCPLELEGRERPGTANANSQAAGPFMGGALLRLGCGAPFLGPTSSRLPLQFHRFLSHLSSFLAHRRPARRQAPRGAGRERLCRQGDEQDEPKYNSCDTPCGATLLERGNLDGGPGGSDSDAPNEVV